MKVLTNIDWYIQQKKSILLKCVLNVEAFKWLKSKRRKNKEKEGGGNKRGRKRKEKGRYH